MHSSKQICVQFIKRGNEISCFDTYKKHYDFVVRFKSWKICAAISLIYYRSHIVFKHKSNFLHLARTSAYHHLPSNFWLIVLPSGGSYFVSYYWTIRNHLIFIDNTFQISILLFFTIIFRMMSIWFWFFLILASIVHASSTSAIFKIQIHIMVNTESILCNLSFIFLMCLINH